MILTWAVIFVIGMTVGQFRERKTSISETEISTTTPTTSAEPIFSSNSWVLFSIVSEKWTSGDEEALCTIEVEGVASNGISYKNIKLLKCNSDEAYIELEAGTYTITFIRLPILADGAEFKAIEPIAVIVDGVTPKLVTVELEIEANEEEQTLQIPEETSESDVPSTSNAPDASSSSEVSNQEGQTSQIPEETTESDVPSTSNTPDASSSSEVSNQEGQTSQIPEETTESEVSSTGSTPDTTSGSEVSNQNND